MLQDSASDDWISDSTQSSAHHCLLLEGQGIFRLVAAGRLRQGLQDRSARHVLGTKSGDAAMNHEIPRTGVLLHFAMTSSPSRRGPCDAKNVLSRIYAPTPRDPDVTRRATSARFIAEVFSARALNRVPWEAAALQPGQGLDPDHSSDLSSRRSRVCLANATIRDRRSGAAAREWRWRPFRVPGRQNPKCEKADGSKHSPSDTESSPLRGSLPSHSW